MHGVRKLYLSFLSYSGSKCLRSNFQDFVSERFYCFLNNIGNDFWIGLNVLFLQQQQLTVYFFTSTRAEVVVALFYPRDAVLARD